MNRRTLSLAPCGTYGFGLVLAYLRTSPSPIVERLHEHGFQRALDIGPGVVVEVARENLYPSEEPLTLTIWGETLTPSLVEVVVAHMRHMLVLDVDGAVIEAHLMIRDPALGSYVQRHRGFRPILHGRYLGMAILKSVRRYADRQQYPLWINARTDAYWHPVGNPDVCFTEAVRHARAYRDSGADSLFNPGVNDPQVIARLPVLQRRLACPWG